MSYCSSQSFIISLLSFSKPNIYILVYILFVARVLLNKILAWGKWIPRKGFYPRYNTSNIKNTVRPYLENYFPNSSKSLNFSVGIDTRFPFLKRIRSAIQCRNDMHINAWPLRKREPFRSSSRFHGWDATPIGVNIETWFSSQIPFLFRTTQPLSSCSVPVQQH